MARHKVDSQDAVGVRQASCRLDGLGELEGHARSETEDLGTEVGVDRVDTGIHVDGLQ